MPLIFQPTITRGLVRTNRYFSLFVFGDNLARQGLLGQAAEMRGEPNAIGLPTKRAPTADGFLTDSDLALIQSTTAADRDKLILQLARGHIVVWPRAGIGTGYARLKEKAPAIYLFYKEFLTRLQFIQDELEKEKINKDLFINKNAF